MSLLTILRGGGDLASGVALRLHRAGFEVLITELPEPLVVRRTVAFAEAVFSAKVHVEDVQACLAANLDQAIALLRLGCIPVLIDPSGALVSEIRQSRSPRQPVVLVDARMTKQTPVGQVDSVDLLLGLGPGFIAGENCHAVIETKRGHRLGRVIWVGGGENDTGVPEAILNSGPERVLRAPANGKLITYARIGDHLEKDQLVAEVSGEQVLAPFKGVLRGLLHHGIRVWRGLKLGDVDARDDPKYCHLVSDKSLAVGGGVLEAILSREDLRPFLWT